MAYCAALERRRPCKGPASSNLAPSADPSVTSLDGWPRGLRHRFAKPERGASSSKGSNPFPSAILLEISLAVELPALNRAAQVRILDLQPIAPVDDGDASSLSKYSRFSCPFVQRSYTAL